MSEPAKSPFDLLLDQIRVVVRQEVQAASSGNSTPAKLLFTTKEAATMLNIEESWLAAKARAGQIPHRMLGHYRFFSRDDIDTIIKKSGVMSRKKKTLDNTSGLCKVDGHEQEGDQGVSRQNRRQGRQGNR
jgi:excisionase family DNA binding protein